MKIEFFFPPSREINRPSSSSVGKRKEEKCAFIGHSAEMYMYIITSEEDRRIKRNKKKRDPRREKRRTQR